jgi:hypothetical protein
MNPTARIVRWSPLCNPTARLMRALVPGALVLSLLAGSAACGRRSAVVKPMLAPPRPPAREATPRAAEPGNRADEILGRLRERLKNQPPATRPGVDAPTAPLIGEQSDAASTPTGTGWSVVISPAPDGAVTAPGSADVADPAGDWGPKSVPRRVSLPAKRYVDTLGGAFAAICAVLALRQRARSSRSSSP